MEINCIFLGFGYAEESSNEHHECRWWPYRVPEAIEYIREGKFLAIYENAEQVLLMALIHSKPDALDYEDGEWYDYDKTLDEVIDECVRETQEGIK